jgi:5-(carboxyamino)imidazole ribonucleotide mutase
LEKLRLNKNRATEPEKLLVKPTGSPKTKSITTPEVGIIMGSDSDLEIMSEAAKILIDFGIPHEIRIVSAHRTPQELYRYAESAKSRGIKVIISGAGGAAHLPGMVASLTPVPVIGVPICSPTNPVNGIDSLYSIVQMPPGVPVATVSINGARNAGILACSILSTADPVLFERVNKFKQMMRNEIKIKNKKLSETGYEKYLNQYRNARKGK